MTKYELAVHNLRLANDIYTPGEQLFEENKRDLDVLEELVKKYDKLQQENERIKNKAEWCDGCKEADRENHCCHRYSHFIKHCANEMKEYYENVIKENEDFRRALKILLTENYYIYRDYLYETIGIYGVEFWEIEEEYGVLMKVIKRLGVVENEKI